MILDRIERISEAFKAHGYEVVSYPIPGEELLFADSLAEGFKLIESTMAIHARRYGYRGRSKAALKALHVTMPEPCFGVVVYKA